MVTPSHTSPDPEVTQDTIETYLPDTTENVPPTVEDAIEDIETTDKQIIDKMRYICDDYRVNNNIYLAYIDEIAYIRGEFMLDNTSLFDYMTEAYRWTLQTRNRDVQSFFDELYGSLVGAFNGQEQLAVVC